MSIELTSQEQAKLNRKRELAEAWAKFIAESENQKKIKGFKNAKMPAGIYAKKHPKGQPKGNKSKKRITARP